MRSSPVIISDEDLDELRNLLAGRDRAALLDQTHLQELQAELERARVVAAAEVPPDVVTMHAQVQVRDLRSGRRSEYVLVYPQQADLSRNRISVLAPLGTALLGYRAGDEVEWMMPGGLRRLRIERVTRRSDICEEDAAARSEIEGASA